MSATADVEQVGEVYVVNERRSVRVNHQYRLEGSRITASELADRNIDLLVTLGDLVPLEVWGRLPGRRTPPPVAAATSAEDHALDQVAREGETRLQELRERRQALALDALTDAKAAKDLATVEADIAVAEQALERARLARREHVRREQQAVLDAEAEQRTTATARARELEVERRKLATKVDRALKTYAEALRAWDLVATEQEQQLRIAGISVNTLPVRRSSIVGALEFALRSAGVPADRTRLEVNATAVGPLAARDARLVDLPEEER